jgi:hypothetical protein
MSSGSWKDPEKVGIYLSVCLVSILTNLFNTNCSKKLYCFITKKGCKMVQLSGTLSDEDGCQNLTTGLPDRAARLSQEHGPDGPSHGQVHQTSGGGLRLVEPGRAGKEGVSPITKISFLKV